MSFSHIGTNDKPLDGNHEKHEISIPMPWGYISGTWFGPTNVQPIIAVHGWQDNAGTFLPLVAMLPKDVSILCIDLPGHGHSSHLPKGQFYHLYWDGVSIFRRIIKHYKWDKIKLLGHSLGGGISFLYAASYPEEVDFVICLDVVTPPARDVTKTANITGVDIDKFLKYENLMLDSSACYDYSEMLGILEAAYNGSVTKESAKIMMKRGIQPALVRDKYYFNRDSRLVRTTLGTFSLDLIMGYAKQIKCAYMNIRARSELKSDQPDNYQKVLDIIKLGAKKFVYHEVNGTHHVHLNNPELVAPLINQFLESL